MGRRRAARARAPRRRDGRGRAAVGARWPTSAGSPPSCSATPADVLAPATLEEMTVPAGRGLRRPRAGRPTGWACRCCGSTGTRWSVTAARCPASWPASSSTARSRPVPCRWPTRPRAWTRRVRPAGRPAGRRAADRRAVDAGAVAGAAGAARRLVLGPVAATCCAPWAAACCTWARCPGRSGRASRFSRRDDGTWLGLDGYFAGETLRIAEDHLDLGHVHLHPHALRPRGARARRRRTSTAGSSAHARRDPSLAGRVVGVVERVVPRPDVHRPGRGRAGR